MNHMRVLLDLEEPLGFKAPNFMLLEIRAHQLLGQPEDKLDGPHMGAFGSRRAFGAFDTQFSTSGDSSTSTFGASNTPSIGNEPGVVKKRSQKMEDEAVGFQEMEGEAVALKEIQANVKKEMDPLHGLDFIVIFCYDSTIFLRC
ncbi:hypothetical protein Q3G72_014756 [Acer saccharum]|nr:hypothetical protein Q3G72_014756 [Acer saccharum]